MSRDDANMVRNAASSGRFRMGVVAAARRRLDCLLPVAFFVLLLQIAAPIGASWATAAALADPSSLAEICHSTADAVPAPEDQDDHQHGCGLGCLIWCVLHGGGTLDAPRVPALVAPTSQTTPVLWHDAGLDLARTRAGSNAQARAPPILS